MPLPIITNTVRCTYRGALPSGTQWANVLHFRFTGGAGPNPVDIVNLDAVVRRLYTGAVFSGGQPWLTRCQSTTVTLIDNTVYILNGTSIGQLININAIGSGGSGQTLPQEVAACVTLRTAIRGRSYRGRVYLPAPLTAATATTGNWTSTVTAETVAQTTGVIGALGAINWEWVVASYLHSTAERVATVTMDSRPDVQRRRKR